MKKLIKALRRKYCIIDLKPIQGGFVGEMFKVIPVMPFPDIIQHSHVRQTLPDCLIIGRYYSEKSAYRKLMQLVQYRYSSKVFTDEPTSPVKLMAVCSIIHSATGYEYVTIEKIAMTRLPYNVPMDGMFTVIPKISVRDNGDMTAKDLIFNVWTSEEAARKYLDALKYGYEIIPYLT